MLNSIPRSIATCNKVYFPGSYLRVGLWQFLISWKRVVDKKVFPLSYSVCGIITWCAPYSLYAAKIV